ncbi:TATA box-binding protein-like protein 2 [Dissostichus eleginoides]|uniref:TATA box-binding protein-like protein 2 n=1 Tax=Dissostichus eleginoides TaxID=100907 RepID=A0AAD9BGF9_DISEL|nr:TATA box-binding protein-like protein 2 [Dissostichus eleginoides]
MEESMLERFFDQYIAADSWKQKEEEELLKLQEDHTESSSSLDYKSQSPPGEIQDVSPVTNVWASVKLGCSLDLKIIARQLWNKNYILIMRIREPQATVMIHRNGTLVVIGAKSPESARVAARRCARKIQKLCIPVRFLNFRITNLMATCCSFPVNLQELALYHPCSYEPELFPGLFFRRFPGISVSIFVTGKITVTGAKSEAELKSLLETLGPILTRFRKN